MIANFRLTFSVIFMTLLYVSCGRSHHSPSQTTSISERNDEINIALIFQGPGAGMVERDLKQIGHLFRTDLKEQNFQVTEAYNVTASEMLASLKIASQQVGDRGTLVVYYGGHGLKGELVTGDRNLKFSDIAAALHEGRNTPIRRILFFIQSCYSGTAVPYLQDLNEFHATAASAMKDDLNWFNSNIGNFPNFARLQVDIARLQRSNLPGDSITINGEVVVVTAVNADQQAIGSGRISDTEGGAYFSYALLQTWRDLYQNKHASATLGDLIERTAALQKTYPISKWLPQNLQVAYSHPYLKNELVFEKSRNKFLAAHQQKLALVAQWNQELVEGVNARFKNCSISIASADIEGESAFFFGPEFHVASADGRVDTKVYLGTYNWMSDPAKSVEVVSLSLVRKYQGGKTFRCELN